MAKRKVRNTLRRGAEAGSERAARRLKNKFGETLTASGGGGSATTASTLPKTKFKQLNKAGAKAGGMLDLGSSLGKAIAPEVFPGGSGLDRATFESITPGQLDFNAINQYLQPSVADAQGLRDTTAGQYDEVIGLRRGALGGLNAAENQALKESLFRDIDRGRAGAMRDIARTPGLGSGASFAQRRALGRDYRNAADQANRQLLLDNINLKRQALGDFEGSVAGRGTAVGAATDRLAGLRGFQAQARQNVDNTNISNRLTADQFNSTGRFAVDQFNAGQQGKEIAGRVGAISAGTGLLGDERDNIQARKKKEELLAFLKERDENLFNQAQALF